MLNKIIIIFLSYLPSVPYWYSCPFTVAEDEYQVNITLEAFLDNIVYSIDQSTKEVVKYETALYKSSGDFSKKKKNLKSELQFFMFK